MPGKRGRDDEEEGYKKPAAVPKTTPAAPSNNPATSRPRRRGSVNSNTSQSRHNPYAVQTGNVGTFLLQRAPRLADQDLIGDIPAPLYEQLQIISSFLTQHRAMMALHSNNNIHNNTPAHYQLTMENFATTQLERIPVRIPHKTPI